MFVASHRHVPSHKVLNLVLGPLEARVMEVLWDCDECTVRQVLTRLHRKLAYTTILTTLVRLHSKKLANRRKSGRAYVYSARVNCQHWQETVARDVAAKLLAGPRSSHETLIACLLEVVRLEEPELHRDIEAILGAQRRKLMTGYSGA
jgi:predicted transcriptional regulator